MMFMVSLGAEELSSTGTSYLNRFEAQIVEKVVTRFLMNGVDPAQIGVITPYDGQRTHVEAVMQRTGPLKQVTAQVDGSVGDVMMCLSDDAPGGGSSCTSAYLWL